MNGTQLALFPNSAAREKALAAAREAKIGILISGEGQLFVTPDAPGTPANFIAFVARTPMDMLTFMQNGASSCGSL